MQRFLPWVMTLLLVGAVILTLLHLPALAQQPAQQQQQPDPALQAMFVRAQQLSEMWLIASVELGVCRDALGKAPRGAAVPAEKAPDPASPPKRE